MYEFCFWAWEQSHDPISRSWSCWKCWSGVRFSWTMVLFISAAKEHDQSKLSYYFLFQVSWWRNALLTYKSRLEGCNYLTFVVRILALKTLWKMCSGRYKRKIIKTINRCLPFYKPACTKVTYGIAQSIGPTPVCVWKHCSRLIDASLFILFLCFLKCYVMHALAAWKGREECQ